MPNRGCPVLVVEQGDPQMIGKTSVNAARPSNNVNKPTFLMDINRQRGLLPEGPRDVKVTHGNGEARDDQVFSELQEGNFASLHLASTLTLLLKWKLTWHMQRGSTLMHATCLQPCNQT